VRTAAEQIAALIDRNGPITFDAFMECALYGERGFFARGRGAGRAARDFVTSPQIGPLFGVLVGRALDREWDALDRPDPFVVIEAGAGDGRLAREVLRSAPRCSPALRYLLVERSAAFRTEQAERLPLVTPSQCLGPYARASGAEADDPLEPVAGSGPLVAQLDALPARKVEGVVLANELLDNLPFAIVERTASGWSEIRVGLDTAAGAQENAGTPRFVEVAVPTEAPDCFGAAVAVGARVPVPRALDAWFADAAGTLVAGRGAVLALDYLAPFAEVVQRSPGWLRTYRGHGRGGDALHEPGEHDITADVPIEHAERAAGRAGLTVASISAQADWLRDLGIDELVVEGDREWEARASVGDLAALAARSRRTEAAALTDPKGLGAFVVMRCTR
jgi:SAM-dependent MidA family methyltransferase